MSEDEGLERGLFHSVSNHFLADKKRGKLRSGILHCVGHEWACLHA